MHATRHGKHNNAAISGQINMAISPTRQPGSSIKPITYVAAFEKGWTPSTWIWDVPTQFPDGANPPYEPRNYDGRFHGGLTVRLALSNSFNIPAVKDLNSSVFMMTRTRLKKKA